MKEMYKTLALLVGLVAGVQYAGMAQCSGQFDVTYPDGSVGNYNNGSSAVTYTYCPDGTSTATFTVTEGNNRGGGNLQVLNSSGSVIKTRIIPINDTVKVRLVVGAAGSSFTFRHTINCSNVKTVDIPFTLNPTLSLSASVNGTAVTSTICPGTTITLDAAGATTGATYTFRDASGTIVGQNSTGTLNVTPTTSTFYTVATNTANCGTNTVTQRINIAANELAASASPTNVTTGGASTLTVSGGTGTYQWYANSGNGNVLIATTTSPTLTVNPTATTQYTVQGTTATGNCPDDAITRVSVNGNTLPVTLVSFTAAWAGESARLHWTTATELNNSHFTVERSTDGISFQPVARINGKGTTSASSAYSYLDAQIGRSKVATVYYRLAQQDVDGTISYAAVQVLRGSATSGLQVAAFPNPFADKLQVQVTVSVAGAAILTLLDHLGRPVRQWPATLAAGVQTVDLPTVANLLPGLYFLRVNTVAGSQQFSLSHE